MENLPARFRSGLAKPAFRREMRERTQLAFDQLPAKLRVVATLALVEDCPHGEIAEALNISTAAVKSRLFRATRLLRRKLRNLDTTMNEQEKKKLVGLVKQSLVPVSRELRRDLWPQMRRRLDERSRGRKWFAVLFSPVELSAVPWFDWALLAVLVVGVAFSKIDSDLALSLLIGGHHQQMHPDLRAYMAGTAVPTMMLLVVFSGFLIARYSFHIPIPINTPLFFRWPWSPIFLAHGICSISGCVRAGICRSDSMVRYCPLFLPRRIPVSYPLGLPGGNIGRVVVVSRKWWFRIPCSRLFLSIALIAYYLGGNTWSDSSTKCWELRDAKLRRGPDSVGEINGPSALAGHRLQIGIGIDCERMFRHSQHLGVPAGIPERRVDLFLDDFAQSLGLPGPEGTRTRRSVTIPFSPQLRGQDAILGNAECLMPARITHSFDDETAQISQPFHAAGGPSASPEKYARENECHEFGGRFHHGVLGKSLVHGNHLAAHLLFAHSCRPCIRRSARAWPADFG